MKMSHVVMIIMSVFFVFFLFFDFFTQKTIEFNDKHVEYANNLTVACHDAAKTMNVVSNSKAKIWENTTEIEKTLTAFYETLARSMGFKNTIFEDSMNERTPFVFLVDYDGYYLVYCACFDETGNSIVPPVLERTAAMTSLNTWAVKKGSYMVRYFLNDHIEIMTADNKTYQGKVADVYNAMTVAGENMSSLAYLANKEEYELERTQAIVNEMEENMNYLLNTQITNADGYFTGYQVSLTAVSTDSWCRALSNPTIISFVQGEQMNSSFLGMETKLLNVFAFAGGEVRYKPGFIMWNDKAYKAGEIDTSDTNETINNISLNVNENTLDGEMQNEFYPVLDEVYTP